MAWFLRRFVRGCSALQGLSDVAVGKFSCARSPAERATFGWKFFGGLCLWSLVFARGGCSGELSDHGPARIRCWLVLGADAAAFAKLLSFRFRRFVCAALTIAILQMYGQFECLCHDAVTF